MWGTKGYDTEEGETSFAIWVDQIDTRTVRNHLMSCDRFNLQGGSKWTLKVSKLVLGLSHCQVYSTSPPGVRDHTKFRDIH